MHRTERGDQLSREDREVPRPGRCLLDDERPAGEPGVGADRVLGGEHRGAEDLIPDRQREADVHVLRPVDLVVDPVVVRAHEDPLQGPEPQPGVRVGEGHDRCVHHEDGRGHGAVGEQHHAGNQREQVRHVDQRMRAEDGQHAHVFLRVVELVEAPEHPDPVIREVHEPVARVHRHDDHRDRAPARHRAHPGEDDPRGRRAEHRHERQRERGHERHEHGRVQHRVEEIVAIPAGEQRAALCRPDPLDDEEHADDRDRQGTDHDGTQARCRAGEVGTTPISRPPDTDEHHRRGCERARGEVHPRRDRGAQPRRVPTAALRCVRSATREAAQLRRRT